MEQRRRRVLPPVPQSCPSRCEYRDGRGDGRVVAPPCPLAEAAGLWVWPCTPTQAEVMAAEAGGRNKNIMATSHR